MPESELHAYAKERIYADLNGESWCSYVEKEKTVGETRADIAAVINKKSVAIEIQHSTISIDEIIRRNLIYTNKKISVLWLIPFDGSTGIFEGETTVNKHLRFLHGLYFGRLYYYDIDIGVIVKAKLEPIKRYVEGFNPDTREDVSYTRTLKTKKRVRFNYPVFICSNFNAVIRKEWNHIPRTQIFIDNQKGE
jgi:competence CoiA-like predicted nuclease